MSKNYEMNGLTIYTYNYAYKLCLIFLASVAWHKQIFIFIKYILFYDLL